MEIITHLKDVIIGKHSVTCKRSPKWPKVRAEHLKNHPKCEICGGTKKVEVHHIQPFHDFPEKELDPNNLITLCECKKRGVNCHLFFGHLGNYKNANNSTTEDVKIWKDKLSKPS